MPRGLKERRLERLYGPDTRPRWNDEELGVMSSDHLRIAKDLGISLEGDSVPADIVQKIARIEMGEDPWEVFQ